MQNEPQSDQSVSLPAGNKQNSETRLLKGISMLNSCQISDRSITCTRPHLVNLIESWES